MDPTSGTAGAINLDPSIVAQILSAANATPLFPYPGADPLLGCKTAKPIEVKDCVLVNGVPTNCFRLVFAGDPYTKSP